MNHLPMKINKGCEENKKTFTRYSLSDLPVKNILFLLVNQ